MIGAFVLAVLVAAGIWKLGFGKGEKTTYQTAKVEKGTLVSSVSASGQILSSNVLNITTQATGVVKAVYVKNEDRVYAEQKIAEITLDSDGALANAKAYASLVSAQNGLNSANNNYRSTQASVEKVHDDLKGHDSDETFAQKETRTKAEVANDNAYDGLKTAQASLVSASLAYRQTSPVIVAPNSGIIDNITITPGMVLSGADRVAVIAFEGNPLATFNVSEVDVSRVTPGQEATVTLDSIAGKSFKGKVLTVDKIGSVDSGVTNYPVMILLDTDPPEILPNMAATADIILETKENVLMVPLGAVQVFGDQNIVRVLRNEKVEVVRVETGLSNDTQTEVVSGLSEGDEVITGGTSQTSLQGSTSPFSTFRIRP